MDVGSVGCRDGWGALSRVGALGAAWLLPCALAAAAAVPPECFEASGRRHGIDPELLKAVARTESGMRADAVNRSHFAQTRTLDIGLMQTNTGWLPVLARHGIREADLYRPCTNIDVGAWILAGNLARHGNTWEGVGAYNASCTQLKGERCVAARSKYAWSVRRHLAPDSARAQTAPPAPTAPAVRQRPPSVGLLSLIQLSDGDEVRP